MLNQSLRAAAGHSGMHALRRVAALCLVSILMLFGLQVVGDHSVASAQQASDKKNEEPLPSAGVTPENQNENDLYISNIKVFRWRATKDDVDTAKLAVKDSIGRLYLEWSNKHPNQPKEQAPTIGKSFTFELPRQLWFDRIGQQRNSVPMLFGERSVGDCVFYADNNRLVTCKLNQGAVDLWNEGFHSIHGEFRIDMTNAGYVKPESGTLPAKVKSGDSETTVELILPGGEILPEAAPGIGPRWLKSNNFPKGPDERISWYFLFNGAKLVEKLGADKVNGRDEITLIIDEHAEAPLKFDPARQNLDLRKETWLRPCTLEELEQNRRGIDCGVKSEKTRAKTEFKLNPTDPTRAEIHITYAFEPDKAYAFSGVITDVYGNIVLNREYRNNARMYLRQPDGSKGTEIAATGPKGNNVAVWRRSASATAVAFSSFAIDKKLGGENAFAYTPDQEVEFEYRYEFKEGTTFANNPQLEKLRNASVSLVAADRIPEVSERGGVAKMRVRINGGITSPSIDNLPVDFPKETKITLREIFDTQAPQYIDREKEVDYFWEAPKYNGKKVDTVEFTIAEKGQLHVIEAENINYGMYPIYIAKKWQGIEDADRPENIEFKYTCTGEGVDNAEKTFVYNARGEEKQLVGKFRAGTKCQFKEVTEGLAGPANMELTPQWSPAVENEAAKGEAIADKDNEGKRTATVTNSYVRNVGTFKVKKTVQGVVGEAGNGKSFKFTYTCSDNQSGEVDVPGNGEAVAVDKQFPIGTTCDVQEADAIEPIENHDLVKPAPQQVQIAADEQTLTFVNAYKSRGTFEVAKRVEGVEEAALQGKTYSFDYVCGPEKGRIENVIPGGPAVPAPATFPTGTTCTVTESLEAAKVEGYTVAPHKPVEVTIGAPGAPLAKAEFVNKYTRDLGSFKIRKSVKGDGNFTNDSFDVQYRCGAAEPVTLNLKGNEEWTVVENLPTGTECVISEDQATAKRAGFTEAIKIDNPTVTIDKAKVAEVTVTNTYAQNKGGFTISKSLAGNGQNRAKDKEFTFSYKCTDPQGDVVKEEKQLKVKAGEVKSITDVPELATCVVEELDGDVQNADLKTAVKVELEGGEVGTPEAEKPASPAAPANNGAPAAEANENAVAPAENAPANNAAAPQPVVAVPVADPLEEAGEAANEDPAEGEAPKPAPAQPAVPAAPADNAPAANAPAVVAPEKPEKQDTPVVVDEGMADGNKATFTIGKDTTHKVLVVNEYTDHVGGLSVTKIVEGDSVEMIKDQPFIFDIKCEDGQSKVLEVLGNGTPVDSGLRIPVGTKCEVSEQTDKAQRAAFDLKAPEKQEVTITKRDEVVATTFKNEYIKHVGTFSVAKNVKGLPAEEAKNKEFLFNYSCFDGQKGEIKVKGDGVAVDAGVKIPVGTDCTVTENAASAKVKGFTVKLPENQNIRFEKKDQKSELSFTNEYKPEPSAPVPGNPDPKGGMDPKDPPKNTPPNPGILGFLPFIPFLFGNAGSSGTPNGTNAETVAGTNNTTNGTNGGANNATNTANPAGQKSLLANTGASVIGIGLLALVVTSVGIFLAVRGRKNKS